MNAKQVASIILNQLGSRQFLAMTGTQLAYFDRLDAKRKWPGLQLTFPIGRAKCIKIALCPNDTYTVQFFTKTGKLKKEMADIYCFGLVALIEQETGLYLHL